jgi:L-alanine-DL-glutamate epimerase-like enolase superfamily enzyme
MAATRKGKVKISDAKVMIPQGHRTYTLVKVPTDSGLYGICEGLWQPRCWRKRGILEIRPYFIGKDAPDVKTLKQAQKMAAGPGRIRQAVADGRNPGPTWIASSVAEGNIGDADN